MAKIINIKCELSYKTGNLEYYFNGKFYDLTCSGYDFFGILFRKHQCNELDITLDDERYSAKVVNKSNGCYGLSIKPSLLLIYFCRNHFDEITGNTYNVDDVIYFNVKPIKDDTRSKET